MGITIKTRRGKLKLDRVGAVWSRFACYVRPYRLQLVGAFAAALGAVLMQILAPWPIKLVFDSILSDKIASNSWLGSVVTFFAALPGGLLAWICAAIFLFAVLDAVFAHLRDVTLATVGQRVVGKIRQDVFAHLQSLEPTVFERRPVGDLIMRLTGDIQLLKQMLVGAMIFGAQSAVMITIMLAAMFWLNPVLAILAIATAPILALASWVISRRIRKAAKGQREKESLLAGIAHDVLGSMAVVQAYNREPIEQKRFSRQNRSSVRAGVKTTRLESKLYRIVSLGSACSLCAILYVGVSAVLDQRMTPGDLLVFISYLRALNKPIRNIAKLTSQTAKAASCGQRVADVFAIEPKIRNRRDAVALSRARGAICFENVSFSYEDGPPALRDVSLRIEPHQRVAIVGHTGAGKTTLFKLLLRFVESDQGAIRLDDYEIANLTLDSLRRQMGWVSQDTLLFGMSVADNIALANPDADPRAIRRVATCAHAHQFIESLQNGYDTVLGEKGASLSGGERQRLALARALLRDTPVLLLDEPATALDSITRSAVEQAWMSPANTATTLVICHRLVGMDRFDRVIMLDRGRVADMGAHRELIDRCPSYADLVNAASESTPDNATEALAC